MSYNIQQQPLTFNTTIRRFEPRMWEVNYNIEAAATIITTGPNSVRMKALLRTNHCLVGMYWRSKDRWGHPLFSYQQIIDWTNCTLTFDLTYTGSPPINDTNNPLVLTALDMSGKSYYVYLENYMSAGSPSSTSGSFSLNFNSVKAGVLATDAIPWNFIDSIFIGFTSSGYDKNAALAPITETAVQADITNIAVSGANSTIGFNNTALTAHELLIADGFADSYPLTPERVIEQMYDLGYRTKAVLYMGFTQWLSLTWSATVGDLQIDASKPPVNAPAQQWLSDYCTRNNSNGVRVVMSQSYELLTRFAPADWCQKDYAGNIGVSGWSPSSSFLTPNNASAFAWYKDVAIALVGLGVTGMTDYQVGEPWWWPGGYSSVGPCFYDPHTTSLYTSETGNPVPTPFIKTIYDDYSAPAQTAYLTWLQGKLGSATTAVAAAVRAAHSTTKCTVLFYTPTVSNPLSPMVHLVNFPAAAWSSPQWDYVEVEDYEVIEFGNFRQQELDLDVPLSDLGYALPKCEYFSGFNLLADTIFVWNAVDKAIWTAFQRKGYSTCVAWARPQVCRDGWVYDHNNWPTYAANAPAPTYPVFPTIATLGWSVIRTPRFANLKAMHVSGKEIRSPMAVYPIWEFELTYQMVDSGPAQTYQQLLSFFQAMRGRGGKFVYIDPEFQQCTSQYLGTGTGFRDTWTLCRSIANFEEPIGYLVALTAVYVNGVELASSAYTVLYDGKWPQVRLSAPAAIGAIIAADFSYGFVCSFYNDQQAFEEFMSTWHSAKSVKFKTVKP